MDERGRQAARNLGFLRCAKREWIGLDWYLAERRGLMADWATYCGSDAAAGATVTPIRGVAA